MSITVEFFFLSGSKRVFTGFFFSCKLLLWQYSQPLANAALLQSAAGPPASGDCTRGDLCAQMHAAPQSQPRQQQMRNATADDERAQSERSGGACQQARAGPRAAPAGVNFAPSSLGAAGGLRARVSRPPSHAQRSAPRVRLVEVSRPSLVVLGPGVASRTGPLMHAAEFCSCA